MDNCWPFTATMSPREIGVARSEDGVVEHALEIHHGRSGGDNFQIHRYGERSLVALSAGVGHGVGGDRDGVAIGAGREAFGIDGDPRGVRDTGRRWNMQRQ